MMQYHVSSNCYVVLLLRRRLLSRRFNSNHDQPTIKKANRVICSKRKGVEEKNTHRRGKLRKRWRLNETQLPHNSFSTVEPGNFSYFSFFLSKERREEEEEIKKMVKNR